MSFENEIGVLPPIGYWDPLGNTIFLFVNSLFYSNNSNYSIGLAADGDAEKFKLYRTAELKHGRVAMLAVTGYIVQEFARFPGAIDLDGTTFASVPNGVAAIGVIPSLGWLQIVASAGYWDLIGWEDRKNEGSEFGVGDFGLYQWLPKKPEVKTEFLTKEIQNGRLAMLAIIELITHDLARPAGEGLFVLHHF
jgi:hypothetical protein